MSSGVSLGEIVRRIGPRFEQSHRLTRPQRHALRASSLCPTEALGGHLDQCSNCGFRHRVRHSCRNRHCPRCQAEARKQWLEELKSELLPYRTSTSSSPFRTRSTPSLGPIFGGSPTSCSPPLARRGPRHRLRTPPHRATAGPGTARARRSWRAQPPGHAPQRASGRGPRDRVPRSPERSRPAPAIPPTPDTIRHFARKQPLRPGTLCAKPRK